MRGFCFRSIFLLFLTFSLGAVENLAFVDVDEVVSRHNVIFNRPASHIPVPHSVDAPLLGEWV